jgi:hypothetical protein
MTTAMLIAIFVMLAAGSVFAVWTGLKLIKGK